MLHRFRMEMKVRLSGRPLQKQVLLLPSLWQSGPTLLSLWRNHHHRCQTDMACRRSAHPLLDHRYHPQNPGAGLEWADGRRPSQSIRNRSIPRPSLAPPTVVMTGEGVPAEAVDLKKDMVRPNTAAWTSAAGRHKGSIMIRFGHQQKTSEQFSMRSPECAQRVKRTPRRCNLEKRHRCLFRSQASRGSCSLRPRRKDSLCRRQLGDQRPPSLHPRRRASWLGLL